jgi:hypothetical protein
VRIIVATCAGLVALSAISVQAAPLPPAKAVPTEVTVSPPIELAAEGCGYGQRRTRWQDQWGYWRWGRCVPKSWGESISPSIYELGEPKTHGAGEATSLATRACTHKRRERAK